MKRGYIYILILTMAVCLTGCGKSRKSADISGDNQKETVSQTAVIEETKMLEEKESGSIKNSVTDGDIGNVAPVIEFDKSVESTEAGNVKAEGSKDLAAKSTEAAKATERTTESTSKSEDKAIELPFAPIN